MNADSHINFPVQFGDTREVTLEGEAMFEVTHDEARPFIIKTHDHTIYVLGTTFNISAYPDEELSVTLIEGKLKVNAPSGEYYLLPGEHYSSAQSKVYKVDPEFYISWFLIPWMLFEYLHYSIGTDGLSAREMALRQIP